MNVDDGTLSFGTAIDMGGFMNGIGEWRMERDGDFGRYHVEFEEA